MENETLTIDQVINEPTDTTDNQTSEPVSDVDNQQSGQEDQTTDTEGGTTGRNRSQYYTPDEMRNLDVDHIDTSRIPPEQLPIYRAIQAVNTRKSQELSNLKREYETRLAQFNQTNRQVSPQEQLYNAYKQNPGAIVQGIYNEISKLQTIDPMDENFRAAQAQIVQLHRMKDEFATRVQYESQTNQNVERITNEVANQLYSKIPNYEQRAPQLESFAKDKLGLTPEDLQYFSTPGIHGERTTRLVLALNKAYEIINAGQVLKNKENRKPNYVEPVGQGNRAGSGNREERLKALEKQAQKEGTLEAWSRYAQAQIELGKE